MSVLLAHHPEVLDAMRAPTKEEPWRILVSGCLAAWPCGVDGSDYGLGAALGGLISLPTVRAIPFCPEEHTLGTPRTMPDCHGGDGLDVLEGRAKILDEHGADLTTPMVEGARAMADLAVRERAELAILTDMSAACGSQVISWGCRLVPVRAFQKGVGVATAAVLRAGIPVVAQRDHSSIARIRARLDPSFEIPEGLVDHHENPWCLANLPGPHPRA